MSFRPPPDIRRRLLHEIILDTAQLNPDYPLAFTLDADRPGAKIERKSFRDFASDIHKASLKLNESLPKRTAGTEPVNVGFFARHSYVYSVYWVACMVNGWAPILISIKNSQEAVKHLLTASSSKLFVADSDLSHQVENLNLKIPVTYFDNYTSDKPFRREEGGIFRPDEITAEQRNLESDLPSYFMHTSGSTGHPKLIPEPHRVIAGWMESSSRDNVDFNKQPFFQQSPLYHSYGAYLFLQWSIVGGSPCFLVHSSKPFTGDSVNRFNKMFNEVVQKQEFEVFDLPRDVALITVPSILIEIFGSGKEAMEELRRYTRAVVFGGAPLPLEVGDAIADAGVNIFAEYGSTETGFISQLYIPEKPLTDGEWRYISLKKGFKYNWLSADVPERNQLVILPDEDETAVYNHTDPKGYDTSDIWIEHPIRKGWYRHYGRSGDITVLSNGEKTNNKQLEQFLHSNNNKIANVLVFGSGRQQNGILLSLTEPLSPSDALEMIWPTVVKMNGVVPTHSRVVKGLVLFEDSGIPFATTDKGTVREKITLDMYKDIIENAYKKVESSQVTPNDVKFPSDFSKEPVAKFLRDTIKILLPEIDTLGDDVDLFDLGLDSLHAIRLSGIIKELVKIAMPKQVCAVPRNVVYDHPTLGLLTNFTISLSKPSDRRDTAQPTGKASFSDLVEKYTADFRVREKGDTNEDERSQQDEYVILTGSTGSLGSFILNNLLERPTVKRVFCLNRKGKEETVTRQLSGFVHRGLDAERLERDIGKRILMFDVDLSKEGIGLTSSDYESIRSQATHVIHAAWHLDFNLSVQSFERVHIAGTRRLVDLALSSSRQQSPHFVFLSSISTVTNAKKRGVNLVQEETVVNEADAKLGYGLSKLVGERIVEAASRTGGLRGSIIRIGQISGSSRTGTWAKTEYIPTMLRSSVSIGKVPFDLPSVRWIPVDTASSVVANLAFNSLDNQIQLNHFHLENPISTPWSDIVQALKELDPRLKQITYSEWLSAIRKFGPDDAKNVPAARLLGYFENLEELPALDVRRTSSITPEVNYGALSPSLLKRYIDYQFQ